ncbi:hypothetical protein MLD38_009299 [Melastoma candidum]|uniref:Uncharacterized protein n=1 Tax=Melastoma candidum TaxID=119954 RepID=A0ACB9RXN5_9MYRT|nr:hypothetical protein MLD38_009299 [Melastoma candidum]
MNSRSKWLLPLMLFGVVFPFPGSSGDGRPQGNEGRSVISTPIVQLHPNARDGQVVMDNGLVRVRLSYPEGEVIGISYNGIDNLLDVKNRPANRGYLDLVWGSTEKDGATDIVHGTRMTVIQQTGDVLELSFLRKWSPGSPRGVAPLNIDKRYVMLRNSSGFYTYAIFEREAGWPEFDLGQARVVFKLNRNKFHYMAVSDKRRRVMPAALDRARGIKLGYPEAVLLNDHSDGGIKGEVDDKYQYSVESQNDKVHGWISQDPSVGFWMITPSYEFRTGGPTKQDLTSHVGPTTLGMFMSDHYGGRDFNTYFTVQESWKKVFGPVMIYLNSATSNANAYDRLWADAKAQMTKEVANWPYNFISSSDFPPSSGRGTVSGQLMIHDRYINTEDFGANFAYVGLALPGNAGSWQTETKGYQFWTRSDENGSFVIKNIRPGVYNLFTWVPGILGDYKYEGNISVKSGSDINMGTLLFNPPRQGPTLWEIGIPDRSAAEFYVPDPNPSLINEVLLNDYGDRFRQYGLWARYAELYPNSDLTYTVGVSNYSKDWFYAHVTKKMDDSTFSPTTWQIKFDLHHVEFRGRYTLQVALASSTEAQIQFRFNNQRTLRRQLTTPTFGWDNAIARHGIHGLYHFYSIDVPGSLLQQGSNTIYVTQPKALGPYQGLMYDYIRLEGPPTDA